MRALLTGAARPALMVDVIPAALQQFSGINTILYYAPTIMEDPRLTVSNAIYYAVFIGVINVVMTVVSVKLVDRLGRRPLLLASLARMGASIGLLGVAFAADLSPVITLVFMLFVPCGVRDRHRPDVLGPSRRDFSARPTRRDPARARP